MTLKSVGANPLKKVAKCRLVPEQLVVFLSGYLGYEKMDAFALEGRDLVRAILNSSLLAAAFISSTILIDPPVEVLICILILIVASSLLLVLLPRLAHRQSAMRDLKVAVFSLDIFSTVYLLTGSIEVAASYLAGVGSETSIRFRKTLFYMRNGIEPRNAILKAFLKKDEYHDWIRSVAFGSLSNTASMMEILKNQTSKNLARSEDASALVILFSCLMPIITAMLFLVVGLGSSATIFLLPLLEAVEFSVVYLWLRDLVYPID
jgi:hypothetical protein